MNEFMKLNNSVLLKSADVTRYSMTYQSRVETLSNHISDVAMMCYYIWLELRNRSVGLDIGQVLRYAVTHDAEEILTGDIVRSVKYYDDYILNELRRVADEVEHNYTDSNDYDELYSDWKNSKSGTTGYIVKIVDMLCVAHKCIEEVSLLGNNHFLRVSLEAQCSIADLIIDIINCPKYYIKTLNLEDSGTHYILSLLTGALVELYNINDKNRDIIKSLELYNSSINSRTMEFFESGEVQSLLESADEMLSKLNYGSIN